MSKKKIAVIGLGQTGYSVIRYLLKKRDLTNRDLRQIDQCGSECQEITVLDTRTELPGVDAFAQEHPAISVKLGPLQAEALIHQDEIIVSPGVSIQIPAIAAAIKQGVSVIGDVELFARATTRKIIAITGSNAKSTVTTLVGEMVKADSYPTVVAGNIGVPVLDTLDQEWSQGSMIPGFGVLELSSFQLETTHNLNAKVAAVLNITPDHLDRYDSVDAYREAKLRIFQGAACGVVNRGDIGTCPKSPGANPGVQYSFGLDAPPRHEKGAGVNDGQLCCGDTPVVHVNELKIKGQHNVENALAAMAIAFAAGISAAAMREALLQFEGLPHRCQWIRSLRGVEWFNDSKGTNVGATVAAINGLAADQGDKNIILIAGGVGKGADFSGLNPVVPCFVKKLILLGEAAEEIRAAVKLEASCVSVVDSLEEAVAKAHQVAVSRDRVLLSPAAASFDMFAGFEDRGNQFIEQVNALQE